VAGAAVELAGWSDMSVSCWMRTWAKRDPSLRFLRHGTQGKQDDDKNQLLELGAHATYYVVYCYGADWMILCVYYC
jgi:hypothetical protein